MADTTRIRGPVATRAAGGSVRLAVGALAASLVVCVTALTPPPPARPVSAVRSDITLVSSTLTHAPFYEHRLLVLTNLARARHGLRPLLIARCASAYAHPWARRMASEGRIFHHPDIRTLWGPSHCRHADWVGEDVGMAEGAPIVVFRAYMASPKHRAIILKARARYVGIGAYRTGGWTYDVMDFSDGTG